MKAGAQLGRRVYAALLHLYPADFRRDYAEELTLLFVDMHRAAAAHGMLALVGLWVTVLLDLASSAMRERIRTMLISSRSAAVLSVMLCLPFLLVLIGVTFFPDEPAFLRPLSEKMVASDGYTTTRFGYIVMFGLLFSLPAAFVINLLSMLTWAAPEQITRFKPAPAHAIIGMSILVLMVMTLSQQVLRELGPFVRPLGSASILGQGLCLLALLPLPSAFLLNRLPRLSRAGSGGIFTFQPTSINLIVGAAILLNIIMFVSAFALETFACSIGVPNCD